MKPFIILVFILKIKTAIALQSNLTSSDENKCVILINKTKTEKSIGETWNSTDPCVKHVCENSDNGKPVEKTVREYCFLNCNNEFEIIAKPGQCCGECIQTKCKFNNSIYSVGAMWKSSDGCTFYECIRSDDGIVRATSYKKICPPIEPCEKKQIYVKDCCQYCNRSNKNDSNIKLERTSGEFVFKPEKYNKFMDKDTYTKHVCKRKCIDGVTMTCNYTFIVEWYETLSKACYDCPFNQTDCFRPHCIFADGVRRSIMVINRMLPGPTIDVCLGDTIIVDVVNNLMGEATTIHWHGMHQYGTPYMDGVPHVTQCPITPETTFRYTFKADNSGTHWWHSHTGVQRSDGAYGALIIRKAENLIHPTVAKFYNLTEHILFIQDWHHQTGVSGFGSFHHSIGNNKPTNLLINGKGKYIPEVVQTDNRVKRSKPSTQTTEIIITTTDAKEQIDTTTIQNDNDEAPTTVPKHIEMNDHITDNLNVHTPLEIFQVEQGQQYLFRIINAGFLNCPIEVSVDNHTLIAFATDGYNFEPVEVDTLVSYAGERWDFIITANRPVENYWMRFRGLMDCDERFTSAHQVAILRYKNAEMEEPKGIPVYNFVRNGIQLNPLNRGTRHIDSISVAELSAIGPDDPKLLQPNADYKFFIHYDFYDRDNPHYNDPKLYSIHSVPNPHNQFFGPQLNLISMKMPPKPFLIDKDNTDDSKFCNATSLLEKKINCKKEFCECSHVLQVPLNASVELIIVDEGYKYDANHPFHLHGHGFRVVGMERIKPKGISIEEIQALEEAGKLPRRLSHAPLKDTVTVPDGGYTIIRFNANNPGYWLFHCHIDYHIEVGMALVFKVGNAKQMPDMPKNFPTCWNFIPNEKDNVPDGSTHHQSTRTLLSAALTVILLIWFDYIIF